MSGLKGERRSVDLGFSTKPVTSPDARDFDDAEAGDLLGSDGKRGEGDVGAGVPMLLQHAAVVHLVDVVAGEDEDVLAAPRRRWSRCSGRRRRRCPGTRILRRAAWAGGSQ